MAENQTRPTDTPIAEVLDRIEDPVRRADCEALVALLTRITGCPPVLWGTGIVGFGSYHYRYASGREGDMCVAGFASRKPDLTIYVTGGFDGAEAILETLGKHRCSKACLYVKRLADVDMSALEALLRRSVDEIRRLYP